MRHFITVTTAAMALLALNTGCGKTDDRADTAITTKDLAADPALLEGTVSSMGDAAIESIAGNESASAASLLDLSASVANTFTRTKTCAVEGSNAKVSIAANLNRSFEATTKFGSMTRVVAGSSSQTRIWSRTGGTVVCATGNKYAKIDWADVTGLSLNVTFKRDRAMSTTQTFTIKPRTVTKSRTFSAEGTRALTWEAAGTDGTNFTRSLSIVTHAKRTLKIVNKKGTATDIAWTIDSKADAPLKVDVVRDADQALVSKTIKSGTLVATRSGGTAETTFTNFEVDYSGVAMARTCTAVSGSFAVKVFGADATTPLKSYTVTVSYTGAVMNDGTTDTEIDVPGCDPEDATE